MPPRWPRKPDRNDPEYRRLDDRMNFAIHVGLFSATNNLQKADWPWAISVTGGWALVVLAHAVYIFAIADYSPLTKDSG